MQSASFNTFSSNNKQTNVFLLKDLAQSKVKGEWHLRAKWQGKTTLYSMLASFETCLFTPAGKCHEMYYKTRKSVW